MREGLKRGGAANELKMDGDVAPSPVATWVGRRPVRKSGLRVEVELDVEVEVGDYVQGKMSLSGAQSCSSSGSKESLSLPPPLLPPLLRQQQQQQKLKLAVPVVHNYGHGGSGWTIMHGTARHAADLVDQVFADLESPLTAHNNCEA
jgi:glycine/D-amino acid oxidase-like deaminating enzyme